MQSGVVFSERDFFKNPLSAEEIRELVAGISVADIFSWRSPAAKKLGSGLDGMDDDGLIELILKEPRLIRRPLVRVGDRLIVGANLKELETLKHS